MKQKHTVLLISIAIVSSAAALIAEELKDLGLQWAENPPMQRIYREAPTAATPPEVFELRDGFSLIETLADFRTAIRKDSQRIRLKPGVYRATTTDAALKEHQHIFAVTGSRNHFDLRGVVFETPVSLQSTLSSKAHVSDSWHIFGDDNTFEGGFFRNVVDRPYPEYSVTEAEFEVLGNGNTFRDCTFVTQGSIPYGYSDYYGKGGPNYGRLNKHSCMGIHDAKDTTLYGCKFYVQSFGHCVYFSNTTGLRIEKCFLTGTLRPTNDIFKERVGRAVEYDFHVMYRGKRPIPRDEMIPLAEDGIRSYGGDKDLSVIDTTVERFRGGIQLSLDGDVTLDNVTVLEAGDYSYDVTSGGRGKVVMKNCRSDVAYGPVFNLTRGDVPVDAFYEVTIVDADVEVRPTPRTSLGAICGDRCTFIFHDGTTRPLSDDVNYLHCGGYLGRGLTDSTVTNNTRAKLILSERVRNCVIKSVGPVEDRGEGNKVIRLPHDGR